MTLRDNIDTNKNNRIDISSQCNEINNFILDKNKGEENLNELGKHLNNLDTWKLDNLGIKDALQSYFGAPERTELNKKIKGKINKNEPLTNKELSLLYLEMITNKNNKLTEQKLKFDSKQPIEKICGGALISYIRTKYNFPTYTGKKVKIDLPNQQHTRKPSTNPINRMKESQKIGGNINLPENIGEIKESEADFYCNRLITWAEQNFPNEIDKAKRQLQIRHKYKDESIEQAYIKYDTLLIAFNKYCEIVSKNHTKLITSPEIGYKDDEDFKQQMNQIEYFESEISKRYPGIDKILEIVKKFYEEIEQNKKKFFGEDKDGIKLKKAENDYKHFNEFIKNKYKEYDIKKAEETLKKTPNSGDEAVEYFLNYNKIAEFQNEINQKRLSYGDSIKKYTSYTENLQSIHNKYNLEQYKDTLSKYNYDAQRLSHGIDFEKFQKYTNKIKYETGLQNGMKNVSLLGNLLMDKTNKYFPFKEIRDTEIQKQVKQNETDKWRDDLKNNSPRIHWLLTGLSGLYNGLVDFTIGTSSSLGVLILGLMGGEDETLAQMEHKEEFDNRFKVNTSSSQTEEVYNSETGEFNFNLDNTTYTVASSISQMLGLIYGGGAIGKGVTKAFQIGENVAGKIGLFSSSFITQIGGSYQEAVRGGLSGGEALGYSMLSATMQSGLELISPNEVLLGKGSGITKELIRNACKSGSKESIRMVGKIFTRNVWNEIREENIQEALQTVAGNLVNMATDGAFGSEIGADWSWKNFASTAVITTLTTGITTGTSTGRQMSQLNSSDRTKLIEYIKSDNGTYSDVIEMINDGITGTIKIPNVDIQQLQELKGLLTSSTGNTNTGNLNGETINTEIIPDDVEVVAVDDDVEVVAVDDDVEVVAVDDDVEVVAVDDQNIEIGDPKEIRRVANIFSEFADFNVDEYVDSHANIALYGRDEQYIRDVLGFLKEYAKNDKDKNDKTKQDPSCFSYFQNARVVDYILSNSKLKIENMKNLLKDEKINIKDIEYAIKQNNELSESKIKEEIKKFNILLNIKSEEDLQKYITGKKIGSDISGNLEEYINEKGLSENSEQIENWYYGNFNPETQKFTMARDIGNSEFDIKLIQNIINQQNITPRGLEHNSPYALLKELHDNDYESFRLYSEYLLGKNVTSLAGEYSVGSFGQDNNDPALYWHTRVGKDSFIGGAKYRIVGEFNPGEIVRSGELNQVADQTANWPESERVTIGEVSNNNVKQIIDLETGKVIYDRDSGFADLSLSENNQSKKANLEEKYSIDLPKEGENLPQILGSRFHEERRQSRLQSDGTYAPRVEKTSDQTWISEHNGQTEVDIANTPFEDLPSEWQSENLEAAKLALGLVYNKVKNGENITPEMIEEMSEIVHNKRLERNGTEGSFENQRVPYEQLSEIEKEKDKNQILRAIETVEQGNNDHFNGSSQQSEITKAETNETNDKNIELLQELGIEVNLYSIEVTKNLTEEEINTIRDINKLITIDVWGIQLIKESKLTKDNINTIEKLKNMGFEITIYDIERIKGLTKSDIINIGKLKNTGLEITIYDVEKIKGLTDNDINTIEKLKNMGFEISISSIEGIKGLTDSDISHIEKLKNMGFEIKTHKIEKIKGLTDSDISHIEKLKNIGISQLNLNDIEIIRSITENDINKIKKLYNILNNLGIKISIYNIERIRLMTDENVREFELKQDDIIKIKLLKNLGVEINIEDIENVRLLKQDDIDKIERINNLGIKINVLGGLYFLSIELINSLTEEDISKMEQLRFSELLPNEISQDDIEIIRSLTNDEITYLKSIKSDTKNIQDIISFKDYNIILNIAPIKDKRNYIKRKNEYLKNNETLSNEQFNALFKPNTDEYKFQQTQNEDFGTGKYGISDINQTDLGYCYAYTTFELLKKSNFFEVLVRTSMKETNNGREIKLPLGDPNGETIKVNKTEIDQEYLIGENRKVNINSNSALGIKILEIAFIKKSIIQNNYIHQLAKTNKLQPIILKAQEEFKETGDITITGELLEYLESGITSDAMETIINNDLLSNLPITEKEKKIAIIKYINQGNIKIGISRDKDTGDFTVHPKIIENNKNKEKGPDLKYNILCGHAYSIERTYYDESINENLIVFVNPYNTSEKIHITIDECINIFPKRDITTININKIFNKNGEIKAENQDNNTDYFKGKSHKIFEGNTGNTESNSKFSDKILSEINEQNKSEKLEELRKEIAEQYKQSTGEELELTDEQLLSILDAHEQDGKLGELTLGQLKVKVKILSETITEPKVRRFLLEAGFCGKIEYTGKIDKMKELTDLSNELLNEINTIENYTLEIDKIYEVFRKEIYSLDRTNLDYNKVNDIIKKYNDINGKYDLIIDSLQKVCNKTTIRWQFKSLRDSIKEENYNITDSELSNLKNLEDYCYRLIEIKSNNLQQWATRSNSGINTMLSNLKTLANIDLLNGNNEIGEKSRRCDNLLYTIKKNAEYTKDEIHETYFDARQIQWKGENEQQLKQDENSEIQTDNKSEYFDGKSRKIFKGDTTKAESNSKTSDRILDEINEQNKYTKLEELRKKITEQYEEATGEKLELSDEQLLSILDAHEQDGKLGELSIGQLRVKVKILSETITDPKVRRFLLEAGFCGRQSEIINDNKTNVEHLEELGIKIPEVSKERFNKMNLDFEVVKGLKELLIDVSSYIIDVSQFIKFDTAKLKHFQELGIKINEGNINSLNEANLNNKGIINFRELQKIGIQVYEPEILNGTEFNFQKLGQLEELGININKDNIIELNKSEINFQILKRLENIGIKLSDEDIIGISSDKIEINIDKLEQLKEIGVDINEDNIGELNEAKFNINKLKQLKEIGVNINEDNIGELNEAKFNINKLKQLKEIGVDINEDNITEFNEAEFNIDKLKQLKEIGVDINEDNITEFNEAEFNIDKLRYLKEIGININDGNITKLNRINDENILMLKKIGNEKVQVIIKHKGLDVTSKPEWFIKHINIFTVPDVMSRVTELNKMGIIISYDNHNLLIPKNFKKIKQFSELGIDVSKDSELCLNTEITQDIIKRLNTLKGFGISPVRLKAINRINNLENRGIETNDILSQEYTVNYKEYGIKEDEIKANLQYKKGQIIEEIQQYIQNAISKKENIGETEIINRIRTNLMVLPKTERLNLLTTISEVVEKSNNIRKYIDFENGPYKDKYPNAKTLLCAIRGITEPNIIDKITDDVTVIQHGTGLNFFVGDEKSYQIIKDKSLTNSKIESGGFNTTASKIKELEGTLSVINGKDPGKDTSQFEYEAIWHEGQHNRNSYFMPDKYGSRIAYSKDEILAYSRDGTSIKEIEETLTTPENKGGLYQYNLKGKERENHKKQVKELLGFANDLFELANNSKTGLTKDKVISMLSDTPANERKNLHATITDALKIHIERSTNQTNFDQSKIRELKERFINKIKERAGNNKLINNLLDFWNSTFSEYKINPEELWWAGTTKKETVVNEIESCNSIDEIKHILNNPKYSHIGRGENNKGGIEISAIIDEVVAGRVESDILPLEIRSKIERLIKK